MRAVPLALALLVLASCTWLGVPQPASFEERAASGYGSVTGARKSALVLLQAGVITADDAANVQQQADLAREGLDIARAVHAGDPAAGETRLEMTLATLRALQAYLAARQPTPEALR